jgi:multiple sugar transport system ATP-binding protein
MAKVVLERLARRYRGAEISALAGLDLAIDDGELLVLVGPSGCGKSTALRLIAGLDTPDGGAIFIDGRDVAMVFQGYALYPHMTARDNIAFPLKMRGVPAAERQRRVGEAASMLGLDRLLDRRPGELSGGERQRVAMGRAIVRSPKVFLFDEPLSNLDAALRAELRVELAGLVRRLGTTSIYVTHDQVEAMTMGDRIAVLRGGELQQVGPPRSIYEDPDNTFVAGFLGSPPINWIDLAQKGDLLEGAGAAWSRPEGISLPSRARAGVRPERLMLHTTAGYRQPGGSIELRATITATEPLGAETIVTAEASGSILRAKAPGFDAPARGAEVTLSIAASSILWFDAETGRRLRRA